MNHTEQYRLGKHTGSIRTARQARLRVESIWMFVHNFTVLTHAHRVKLSVCSPRVECINYHILHICTRRVSTLAIHSAICNTLNFQINFLSSPARICVIFKWIVSTWRATPLPQTRTPNPFLRFLSSWQCDMFSMYTVINSHYAMLATPQWFILLFSWLNVFSFPFQPAHFSHFHQQICRH